MNYIGIILKFFPKFEKLVYRKFDFGEIVFILVKHSKSILLAKANQVWYFMKFANQEKWRAESRYLLKQSAFIDEEIWDKYRAEHENLNFSFFIFYGTHNEKPLPKIFQKSKRKSLSPHNHNMDELETLVSGEKRRSFWIFKKIDIFLFACLIRVLLRNKF